MPARSPRSRCRRRRGRCIPIRRACAGWPMRLQRAERPLVLAGRGAVICRGRGGTGRAGRAHRRAAGHLDLRAWAVCRQPLVGRHQRRLCLAGGGRADLGERSHRRVRREPDALDHEAGQADRARRRGCASRRRGGASSATRCRSSIAVQADARVAARGDPGRAGRARDRPARGSAQR